MLSPDYLLHISEGAEEIAAGLHTRMLKQITSRILARQAKGYNYILTSSDKWRLQALMETGSLRDDLAKEIAAATQLQQKEILRAFEDAGVKALDYDDKIYQKAGLSPKALKESPYLIRLMQRNYEATMQEWSNYTRTTADASEQYFIETMDQVYTDVMSGGVGYVDAYVKGINNLASHGLTVRYPSGHVDTIETAALRCVRTGVSQASAQIQTARMDEMGVDLVLVSSHMGARPSHQIWQGKVYSRSGSSEKYADFASSTGYGTGPGLCGWNCRHSFGPYFEGQGNPFLRYNNKENKELYERTQDQRAMERGIRKSKREREVLADAAEKAPDEETKAKLRESLGKVQKRLTGQNKAYREYCDKYDLRPLPERLKIAKAGGANNNIPDVPVPSVINPHPQQALKDVGSRIKGIQNGTSTDREALGQEILKDYKVSGVPVHVKKMQDHGSCGIAVDHDNLKVTSYNLNQGDQRSVEYQIKTAFHEAYHASGNGYATDVHLFDMKKWLDIEETFAECSAHYSASQYGISGLAPSYADKLVKMLPRLKKLPEFSSCKTLSDFGKIALEERLKGGGSVWKDLYKRAMRKKHSYSDFVKGYFPRIRSDPDGIIDKILENMPQSAPHRDQWVRTLESGMNNIEKYGFALSDNETLFINNAVAYLLNTVGVI